MKQFVLNWKKAVLSLTLMITAITWVQTVTAQSYNVTLPAPFTSNGLNITFSASPSNPVPAGTVVTVKAFAVGNTTVGGITTFILKSNIVEITPVGSNMIYTGNGDAINISRSYSFVMPAEHVNDLTLDTPLISSNTACSIGSYGYSTVAAALETITDDTPTTILLRAYSVSSNNMSLIDRNIIFEFGSCLYFTLMGDVSLIRSNVSFIDSGEEAGHRAKATGTVFLDEGSSIQFSSLETNTNTDKNVIVCRGGSTIRCSEITATSLPIGTAAVRCNDGSVSITNRMTCSGIGIIAENGGTVTAYNLTAGGAFGVHCSQGSSVVVEGELIANSEDAVGVFCTDEGSSVEVLRNVTAEAGTGVEVANGGEVSVKYEMTAPTYIVIDDVPYSIDQNAAVSSKPDYLEYTNGTSTVWVYIQMPITITTETLPKAYIGLPYSHSLQATGRQPIYWAWWVDEGDLPDWLSLDEETGVLSGTPTELGTYTFWVEAWNDDYSGDEKLLSLVVEEETGIAEVKQLSEILVYPNPTKGTIYIRSEETRRADICLFDLTGRKVGENKAFCTDSETMSMDLSPLSSGIYLLKVGGETLKVVKE